MFPLILNLYIYQMKNIYKLVLIFLTVSVIVSGQAQGQYTLTDYIDGINNYSGITIKVTDKFISVRGGCNIHTGYFNVSDNNKLAIGPFSSTQFKCDQDYDSTLIKKLTTSSSFNVQNGVLTLNDKNNKNIAKFNKLTSTD